MAADAGGAPARISLMFGVYFFTSGLYLPFFPLWLEARGLDEAAIAIVLAAPMVLRILTATLLGRLADRAADKRRVLAGMAAVATVLGVALAVAEGFWAILALSAGMALAWQAMPPLTDALAVNLARRHGLDYGRMRAWGSATFVAANAGGGLLLGMAGAGAVLAVFLAVMASLIGLCFLLPGEAVPARSRAAPDPRLLRRPGFLAVLAGVALVQASHATFNGFGSIHLQALGYSSATIGLLWSLGGVAEIAVFAAGAVALRRLGAVGLVAVAAVVALLRWVLVALDPGLPLLALLQASHAITFGASYLGLMMFVSATVDEGRAAAAQGIYVMIVGTVTVLATLASGPLYRAFAGHAFMAMALLPAATLLILWLGRGMVAELLAEAAAARRGDLGCG